MSEWMPIETAPKDGRYFIASKFEKGGGLLYVCDCHYMTAHQYLEEVGDYFEDEGAIGGFVNDDQGERWPTHWMPLPAPSTGDA